MGKLSDFDDGPALSIPDYSKTCNCGEKTDVVFIVVEDRDGKERMGWFSMFGKWGRGGFLEMQTGFRFVRWRVFCARCYQRDLIRRNAQQIPTEIDALFLRSFHA